MNFPKVFVYLSFLCFSILPIANANGACSIANLTRCIDSACNTATEYGAATRCIMCGTTAAATANDALTAYNYGGAVTGLTGLALGYNSSARLDTKNAPSEPGARYAWAANECLELNPDCAAADVEKNYDNLIEQSCRAALSEQEYEATFAAQRRNAKTATTCSSQVATCLNVERRCGAGFINCEAEASLNKYFSECLVDVGGCDAFANEIRMQITSSRDNAFAAKQTLLNNIVSGYQTARARKIKTAKDGCADGSLKDACVSTMCSAIGGDCMNDSEKKSAAMRMCAYVDTACGRIK